MSNSKLVEQLFFGCLLLVVSYLMWLLLSPYLIAVVLAGIFALVLFPLHTLIGTWVFRRSTTLQALLSTVFAYILIVMPFAFLVFLLSKETLLLYDQLQTTGAISLTSLQSTIESQLETIIPGVSISLTDTAKSVSAFAVSQLQTLFSNSVNFLLLLFISILATFFAFKDGRRLVDWIIRVSPLTNSHDELLLNRISVAVRSVVSGIIIVSLLQGVVAGLGFWIFGISKPVLWGTVAAFGGLLPGVGMPVVMIPAIIYLWVTGNVFGAAGLLIWAAVAVIVIDNIIAPALMSRGNPLHPFLVLLSILGGISLFGMIGVVLGPVLVSVFLALIEIQKKIFSDDSPPLSNISTKTMAAKKITRKIAKKET